MGELRIISRSGESFRDRREAGRLLAGELGRYKKENPLVLGILRGGIVVAREIARGLGGDFDIILARKLEAPFNPELAIGAVTEEGKLFLNERVGAYTGAGSDYVRDERERQVREIARRVKVFRSIYPKLPIAGRLVILTDDGVATGATMQASLWAVRDAKPAKLVAALPVGPEDSLEELAYDADELVCLRSPAMFAAVGQFYARFDQIEDGEVLEILEDELERRRSGEEGDSRGGR